MRYRIPRRRCVAARRDRRYALIQVSPMSVRFQPGDALLVVDVQNDFCLGGALPVPEGDTVVPVLNAWMAAAQRARVPIFASRDGHPADQVSFRTRGGPWPVHCVQGTAGAEFHFDLRLPGRTVIIDKGAEPRREAYSAFAGTDLAEQLMQLGIRRLWGGGLAQDYCVRASMLDAVQLGMDVHLIREGTRPVDPAAALRVEAEFLREGVVIVSDTPEVGIR
jgi:nicotinamidase/pyrazinamidase